MFRPMLYSLRVRNLAIVENAAVDFKPGLNVITGETGAGKSILINALDLVLGERFDRKMIRTGEDQCTVEAVFHLAAPEPVNALLAEAGLTPCTGGELIVRRVVSVSGASRNHINDSTATVQTLKKVGDLLVDMHGPYDHQSLFSPACQLDVLDAFGHTQPLRDAYVAVFREMTGLQSQIAGIDRDDTRVAQQLDMLNFQIQEIEQAELDGTTEEDVIQEHAKVANAQSILEKGGAVANALAEGETSTFEQLVAAQQHLAELKTVIPEAADWLRELESLATQTQALSRALTAYLSTVEGDPQRLQWLETRLSTLTRLKRKYGKSIPEILVFLREAQQKKKELEGRDERIRELETALAATRKRLEDQGRKLTAARARAAAALAKSITRELQELGFPHGAFNVPVEPCEPTPSGMDRVDFGFAPNVGEPMRSLRSIASSGEISRVMLATKAVLADHDRIPTMVFDEIDTNVGGEMATAVGRKIQVVARNRQVLCITHLPQVAVFGSTHFVVEKDVSAQRTFTHIREVSGKDRIEEVARMLGGRDSTRVVLQHAREMLDQAK